MGGTAGTLGDIKLISLESNPMLDSHSFMVTEINVGGPGLRAHLVMTGPKSGAIG